MRHRFPSSFPSIFSPSASVLFLSFYYYLPLNLLCTVSGCRHRRQQIINKITRMIRQIKNSAEQYKRILLCHPRYGLRVRYINCLQLVIIKKGTFPMKLNAFVKKHKIRNIPVQLIERE